MVRELWKELFSGDVLRLARSLETEIEDKVPEGPCRDRALQHMQEAVWWAARGIETAKSEKEG